MLRKNNFILITLFVATTASLAFAEIQQYQKIVADTLEGMPELQRQEIITSINHIAQTNSLVTQSSIIIETIKKLQPLIDQTSEQGKKIAEILSQLSEQNLKQNFKKAGSSFSFSLNKGFIWGSQNQQFEIFYTNDLGEIITKKYNASLNFVGHTMECAYRFNCIFFTSEDFTLLDGSKHIQLGTGIQCNLLPFILPIMVTSFAYDIPFLNPIDSTLRPVDEEFPGTEYPYDHDINWKRLSLLLLLSSINITYVPFVNAPGGMVIFGLVLGPCGGNPCLITDGTLTPVNS